MASGPLRGRAILLLALFIRVACAGEPVRELVGHTFSNGTLHLELSDGAMSLTLYSENALEAVFTPRNGPEPPPSRAIGSLPGPVAAQLLETEEGLRLQTDGLAVDVRRRPFRVRYAYRGRHLVEEEDGDGQGRSDRGFQFRLEDGEKLFGGGSRALGRMDRRGERFELYSRACYAYENQARLMYYSMPAVVSSKKYMLVFDNTARGRLDLDSSGDGRLRFDAVGGRKAYLLIAGDSWPDLAGRIAEMTGRQPMLPRWALGHISSRMGYRTRQEVESVADRCRGAGIPLDAIVLDMFWFGSGIFGHMGNLDWDRRTFPEPESMVQGLRKQGIRTVLVTEPYILMESSNWADAVAQKALAVGPEGDPYILTTFFGLAGLVDVFNPSAREWFWRFYRRHTEYGVAGWWGDLGEPETHPDDIRHAGGRGDEVHNAYGHEWARLVYEGLRRDFPDRRPFILMRAGFVGTQRYGILPWSGDVARNWGGLKPQVELALQMGLQGVAYMHSDLGGFAGNLRDPELYVRWLQYGVFQPIFRPHGHEDVPAEPVFWDDAARDLAREAIRLRYRLLPYNYTLMFENAVRGLPLMRPLMYLDDSPEMEDCLDAYLWGDAFLVAPVTEPGLVERRVPLPAGNAWFDLWSGARHEGGQTITVPVTLDHIPVFVKAGSFVPMVEPIQNTEQYNPSRLQVHFYADRAVSASTGQLYDDDGKTPGAYEDDRFELLRFRSECPSDGDLVLHLDGERHDYPGRPGSRSIRYVLHALGRKPKAVRVDGNEKAILDEPSETAPEGIVWNESDGLLTVPVLWEGRPRTVQIEI